MSLLTVVIPSRGIQPIRTTLDSLQQQSFRDYIVVVQPDFGHGACWARNRGFKFCQTELVLFCDDDIRWEPHGIRQMVDCLTAHPKAAYSYGSYITKVSGFEHLISNKAFDAVALRKNNFVSTMSVLRSSLFPGFDEKLKRLQDWDLWLTLLEKGHTGVHCGQVVFKTVTAPDGITFGSIPSREAYDTIMRKHGSYQ